MLLLTGKGIFVPKSRVLDKRDQLISRQIYTLVKIKNDMGKQNAVKKNAPMINEGIVESPPEAAKKVLKTSEIKFSVNEQILLTLLAQIVVEIIIKEEL